MSKKIIILDGHSLIYRGFHAVPNLTTASGKPTGAIYGFTLLFLKIIADLKPESIVVAFDPPGQTFRHKLFPDYKAQRPEMDPRLAEQIPKVKELVQCFNVPLIEVPGFEADDVLGTVSAFIEETAPEFKSYIVTGDKDTFQLLSDKTYVYTMKRGMTDTILYTPTTFFDRYSFTPQYFTDYKGLLGDPSDNIPGVKGIGEKTASALIQQFQSLDNLYTQIESKTISDRVRNLLLHGKTMAFFSRELATILRTVPFEFSLSTTQLFETYDRDSVISLFKTLEFSSLISKLPPSRVSQEKRSVPGNQSLYPPPTPLCSYVLVDDDQSFSNFLEQLKKQHEIAYTIIATDDKHLLANLIGISFTWNGTEAYYCNVLHNNTLRTPWIELLKPIFENPSLAKYGHDLKYTASVLQNYQIMSTPLSFDTLIASYLLHPGHPTSLQSLAQSYLGITIENPTGVTSDTNHSDWSSLPPESISYFACTTVTLVWKLIPILRSQLLGE